MYLPRVVHRLEDFAAPPGGAVLSIGNFDGVHVGHQAVFAQARQVVGDAMRTPLVAITFDPSPVSVLRPEQAPARLTTLADKLSLLHAQGVTDAIVLRPDPDLLRTPAEGFLARVVRACRPRAFVEGPGFRFGHARRGSIDTLREHAERYGYAVHEAPPMRVASVPEHERASSSAVRQLLTEGKVEAAAAMLGRPHRVSGMVQAGQGRGGPLGFPTANLGDVPQMLPKAGVYGGVAQFERRANARAEQSEHPGAPGQASEFGEFFLAAINVGEQPTFEQRLFRVEAHLLDFQAELRGQPLRIAFFERIRDQQRFGSVEELLRQIGKDVERIRGKAAWLRGRSR